MRRPATVLAVALAASTVLTAPADAKRKADKPPVVTSVAPLNAVVGQQLVLRGRNFRPGRARNGVGLKADGKPIVFLRSGLSTRRMMTVPLTGALAKALGGSPRRFRLRVLTSRFGKRYTSLRLSPTIGPGPAPAAGAPATPAPAPPATTLPPAAGLPGTPVTGCDATAGGDGDSDGDRLPDGLELRIGTDGCAADSDGDGIEDGYEYRSAIDLNDDEYQQPNTTLPFPAKQPFPNPLDASDPDIDFDGDILTLREEYRLWLADTPSPRRTFADAGNAATPLSYSDGLQYSVSVRCPADGSPLCAGRHAERRIPSLAADADPSFQSFYDWARAAGYADVELIGDEVPRWFSHVDRVTRDIRDIDLDGFVSPPEANPLDTDEDGFISDDERDADIDGLSNYDELHGPMLPEYWATCYPEESYSLRPSKATRADDADSDGDGVRDGADDQDNDDLPNLMELSRIRASGLDDRFEGRGACKPKTELTVRDAAGRYLDHHEDAYGWVHPFNPCRPLRSRSCSSAYLADYTGPVWWALQ